MFSFFLRYVFQIYQDFPDPNLNFGLMTNETSTIVATCALWGDWDPPTLPLCIGKKILKIIVFRLN